MRREMREALERFMDGMEYARNQLDDVTWNASAAVRLLVDIRDRLGGLEAALADDPTDNAPDLAAVVASQGIALEVLGQQVRLLENDLRAVEAALMDERPAPDAEWLVEPVRVTLRAIPGALIPHVSMVRWSIGDTWPAWRCELFPARHGFAPVLVHDDQRVGVRPDGLLEVVS